jgi:CheY-like chemotaxis protein
MRRHEKAARYAWHLRHRPCVRRAGRQHRLVAQTGWGQDEDRRRSSETGFNAHLGKPVDPGALHKLLASLKPVQR